MIKRSNFIKGSLLFVISCLFLTGCGNKECARWETTTNGTVRDCSNISGYYEKLNCELKNDKVKTTQECVEWE